MTKGRLIYDKICLSKWSSFAAVSCSKKNSFEKRMGTFLYQLFTRCMISTYYKRKEDLKDCYGLIHRTVLVCMQINLDVWSLEQSTREGRV